MKSSKQVNYALKVFSKSDFYNRQNAYLRVNNHYKYNNFYEHIGNISKYKQLGLLGQKCRFIVETIATFENDVSIKF